MQKPRTFLGSSLKRTIIDYLPGLAFLVITITLFIVNAFPALSGDEYGSLLEAQHLGLNIQAIGYFIQLHFWNSIFQSDWFLRILSILWFGAGLYWLNDWLKSESIPNWVRTLIVWLALLNPFLWMYGFQIRFYAMFFATSILFVGRFRAWEKFPSRRNLLYLLLSLLLLMTSHLFGTLVLATVFLNYLWMKLGRKRWIMALFLVIIILFVILPVTRSFFVWVVYRFTNNYAAVPTGSAMRGIDLGMLAKIPLSFFFFTMGERVYPLWWWITLPAMLAMGSAFLLGIWQLRGMPRLGTLIVLMLLNVPLLFLLLDPLAPPGLQGAAPRYVIFVIPYFLLLVAYGAQAWKPLKPALIIINLVGLYFLARPLWSYGGGDFTNWPLFLNDAVIQPKQTCIVTDGRAQDPVNRYAPLGAKIVRDNAQECLGFPEIVLVSNDYRLSFVKNFDEMAKNISMNYTLVSNETLFPEQETVYEKILPERFQIPPGRLDLPEQDLRFPINIPGRGWQLNGFVRLDSQTPSVILFFPNGDFGNLLVLTNYRVDNDPPQGTPIFSLDFKNPGGNNLSQVIFSAGNQTGSWQGSCSSCISIYSWTKLFALLGSYYYPGAYQQYQAHIWGSSINLSSPYQFSSITITYLFSRGTGYFWGLFPENR